MTRENTPDATHSAKMNDAPSSQAAMDDGFTSDDIAFINRVVERAHAISLMNRSREVFASCADEADRDEEA